MAKYFETENPLQLGMSYISTESRTGASTPGAEVIVSTVQNWFSIRNRAFELYESASYDQALPLLETLLQENFEIPSTRCHIARILLLTGNETRAREEIEFASKCSAEAPAYVKLRILFFQAMFAILDKGNAKTFIEKLKYALTVDNANTWSIQRVLNHLQSRLTETEFAFLNTLASALGEVGARPKLEGFAAWREIPPASR